MQSETLSSLCPRSGGFYLLHGEQRIDKHFFTNDIKVSKMELATKFKWWGAA